jgi:hypothetical protein
MTIEKAKAAALEALLAGPWKPDRLDPRVPALHLLKRDGVPVVSINVGKGGRVELEHRLIETALQADEVKARRREGLAMALRCHRREPVSDWKGLLDAIPCPFTKDEASEYLRGIIQRSRSVGH